jgi:hypothetical protein
MAIIDVATRMARITIPAIPHFTFQKFFFNFLWANTTHCPVRTLGSK